MPILGSQGGLSSRGFGQFTETVSPPTSPVDGYHLWLDADNAASFTYSSGSVVSQWTDRSPNALSFTTTATVNQPTRSGVQNGKSTVVFDGNRNYLRSTAPASTWKYLHDGSGATLFFVVKSNEDPAATNTYFSPIFSTQSGGTNPAIQFSIYENSSSYNSSFMYISNSNSENVIQSYPITNNDYKIHSYKLDLNNSSVYSKIEYYRNSASKSFADFTTFSGASTADPGVTLCLATGYNGAFGDFGGYPEYMFAGEIAEILTYKSLLSESDIIANVNYLEAKWGISANNVF